MQCIFASVVVFVLMHHFIHKRQKERGGDLWLLPASKLPKEGGSQVETFYSSPSSRSSSICSQRSTCWGLVWRETGIYAGRSVSENKLLELWTTFGSRSFVGLHVTGFSNLMPDLPTHQSPPGSASGFFFSKLIANEGQEKPQQNDVQKQLVPIRHGIVLMQVFS